MKKYLFILSAIVLFAFTSCNKIILSGNNITEEFIIDGSYTELCVENAFEVTVTDAVDQITITTDENVMPKVLVEKDGDKLKIHLKPLSINIGTDLELKVLLPYNADLTNVDLSGASEFRSEYGLAGETVEVELSGASDFYCDINAHKVDVDLSGASNFYGDILANEADVDLSGSSDIEGTVDVPEFDLGLDGASDAKLLGQVAKLKINLTGASNIVRQVVEGRYGLVCEQCEGSMSGASSAYIHCDGNIIVNLSGASDLHFTGTAFTGDSGTSGGSEIIHEVNP